MKTKVTFAIIAIVISFSSFAQLDDIYEKRKWDVFASYSSYSMTTQGGNQTNFSFIKPFYMRLNKDNAEQWRSHFMWYPMLGSELIWGVLWSESSATNDLDIFDRNGISSGLFGRFNWTKNVFAKEDFLIAIGLEFGDYTVGGNHAADWTFGIGPSILVEYAITNSIALGINVWVSKVVANFTEVGNDDILFTGIYPRILFEKGFFLEAGTMFTNKLNGASNSRFDINFGFVLGG